MLTEALRRACVPAAPTPAATLDRLKVAALAECRRAAPSRQALVLAHARSWALSVLIHDARLPFVEARRQALRFRRDLAAAAAVGPSQAK